MKPDVPKVMIVDDDDAVRQSLTSMLGTYGFQIVTFSNASDAIEAARRDRPDCILLDVRMPEMDGLLAQRILVESEPTLVVIMITGHGGGWRRGGAQCLIIRRVRTLIELTVAPDLSIVPVHRTGR